MSKLSIEALCSANGGNYTVQCGNHSRETRDYWLIFESYHPVSQGWLSRSAQIQRSWAMRWPRENGLTRTLKKYSLVLITKGEGQFWDERTGRIHPVKQGDLLCLFPGIAHVYGDPVGYWDEININFSGPIFDPWVGMGLLDPEEPVRHLVPSGDDAEIAFWLQRFYDILLPIARRDVPESTLGDSGLFLALLAQMCESWQAQVSDADTEWAARARQQLLDLPIRQKLDLAPLARAFGLGEQAYRKKFTRLCGVSPFTFRSRQQIEAACHQLIATNRSIKEIGYELGFGDLYYFSRRFKKITGLTPGDYRKQVNK